MNKKKKVTNTLDPEVEAAVRAVAKKEHRPFSSEIEMAFARIYLPLVQGEIRLGTDAVTS